MQNHVRLQMIVADDGQDFSLFAFDSKRSYDVKIYFLIMICPVVFGQSVNQSVEPMPVVHFCHAD